MNEVKPEQAHRGHRQYIRSSVVNVCGKRLLSVITRCRDCRGAFVGMHQYPVRRGQR